jgi:hypothetical protein
MAPDLAAEGYELHYGNEDQGDLAGKYWWTLMRAGWTECESGPTFKDYRAVINSARRHYDKEMRRPVNVRWT